MMWGAWCSVCLFVLSGVLARSAQAQREPADAPRCRLPRCRYLGLDSSSSHQYRVEGNTIEIRYESQGYPSLIMYCHEASVLESRALPRVEPAGQVRVVRLLGCPLPATGSLADTLATLNIQLCKQDALNEPSTLWLDHLPAVPPLAAKHLIGLECLQVISIFNEDPVSPNRGFLAPVRNLRELRVTKMNIPVCELDVPPPLLRVISLEYTGTERLPEAIHSSANLQQLTFEDNTPFDAGKVPLGLQKLRVQSPTTMLQLDDAPALEGLWLQNWVEPLPPVITRCAALREIYLEAPTMHALPDKWLANCSLLEVLYVSNARNLVSLPPTLFIPLGPIKDIGFSRGALESLPEGLLDNLLSLTTLELDNNHIKTLPRNFFNELRYRISIVSLASNDLDGSVFDVLGRLRHPPPREWLNSLGANQLDVDLSDNPRIGDVCDAEGYSPIRHKSDMKALRLKGTGVSRICKDWRKDMPELKLLDLSNTNITELWYDDLQFVRTVQAEVVLRGAPVAAVRLTREDYNKAVRASPSFTTMDLDVELECNCHMYWARRVLDHTLAQHTVPGIRELHCAGGGLLRDMSPDELVCGAREECLAAALPSGCECVARPDDDPEQERWLVRARCENNSLDFVQRRVYPFYPVDQTKNQGVYLTRSITSLN